MRNKPTHIVKGNIFDALGCSASETSALEVKAEILSAILEHIRKEGYIQAQLVSPVDEYQHSVNNLLKGRIVQVNIERLSRYADRLHLKTSVLVGVKRTKRRRALSAIAMAAVGGDAGKNARARVAGSL
jgi:predicted XRE-type DNA-binding protein